MGYKSERWIFENQSTSLKVTMGLFMLVILCVTFSFYGVDGGRSISEREGLKLEAQHMILDEPIANTIEVIKWKKEANINN